MNGSRGSRHEDLTPGAERTMRTQLTVVATTVVVVALVAFIAGLRTFPW